MSAPALFIGVVSHPNSSYSQAQGPDGLAAQIAARLPGCVAQINTRNLWTEGGDVVPAGAERESQAAEIAFEEDWARYVGVRRGPEWYLRITARKARLATRRFSDSGGAVRRLLDIEYSHRNLLERGVASGAESILILEDDAQCPNVEDLVDGLTGLLEQRPALTNLSHSYSIGSLGLGHLFEPATASKWKGAATRVLLTSDLLVTNTVCALLYSREFAHELSTQLARMPLFPVLPIDWKVNKAITHLSSGGEHRSCLWVDPAPIVQASMHAKSVQPSIDIIK